MPHASTSTPDSGRFSLGLQPLQVPVPYAIVKAVTLHRVKAVDARPSPEMSRRRLTRSGRCARPFPAGVPTSTFVFVDVLITGAARGIGADTARKLAAKG